eukprot:GEMP01078504.1.p1 GENE.GEMP01078504.1~~GEMP01078504.1.p1  ORF type:complete len:248 (+),score=29.02 GEMP01078504.1:77-745(+)
MVLRLAAAYFLTAVPDTLVGALSDEYTLVTPGYGAYDEYHYEIAHADTDTRKDHAPDNVQVSIVLLGQPANMEEAVVQGKTWYDCAAEEKIENPKFTFFDVWAVPPTFFPNTTHIVYKSIAYHGDDDIPYVAADFTQFFKVYGMWFPWLHIPNYNQCVHHPELCPLKARSTVLLMKVHESISWIAPYGWYRSRQVYKHGTTQELLGCVDMWFEYRANADDQP